MDNKAKGILYTVISAAAFGLTPLLCVFAYTAGANPETLVFLRNLFVVPVLFIICKVQKVDLRIDAKTAFKVAVVGIFGTTGTALLLYKAYEYLPVGTVTTIHFLYPVFVAIAGVLFFHEKISKVKAVVLLAATLGVFFFLEVPEGKTSQELTIGLVLTVISALTYAFYMVGSEQCNFKVINSYKLTLYISLFSGIAMFLYCLVTGKLVVGEMAPLGFLYAFIIAMGTSFLAVYTLQLGIKYIGASEAAIFCMFEPVTAVIGGWIFLHESLGLMKIIGCIVILGSVTLLTVLDKKAAEKAK